MSYSVDWLPSAEQELANLWNNAADRTEVAAAADMVDASLAHDLLSLGEARSGSTRIVFVEPLAVLFDVDVKSRKVKVWDLWRWPA